MVTETEVKNDARYKRRNTSSMIIIQQRRPKHIECADKHVSSSQTNSQTTQLSLPQFSPPPRHPPTSSSHHGIIKRNMADPAQPPSRASSPPADDDNNNTDTLTLTIQYHSQPITLTLAPDATISDLSNLIATDLSIPPSHQKFLCAPKPGLLRPPFKDPTLALSSLQKAKITLLGTTSREIADIDAAISSIREKQEARRAARSAGRKVQAFKHRDGKKVQEESVYTFATLRPLAHLHDPEKSLRFLERLRDDPGVRAAMRAHKFSVGLLTEMDPAEHTTHSGKTLGLNRNRGEVIELRLRTDAYDGYRDYKTIRRTLAHELAHNVVGPHNAEFHALWNVIEKEIERNDYSRGGQTVGQQEFYNPNDGGVDEDEEDDGGWEGGSYVLGGGAGGKEAPLGRREIMAKAAEERMKRQQGSGSSSG